MAESTFRKHLKYRVVLAKRNVKMAKEEMDGAYPIQDGPGNYVRRAAELEISTAVFYALENVWNLFVGMEGEDD